MIGETKFVEQIRRLAGSTSTSLIQSIGDDCAILRPAPGRDLVFTTDFTLEGRHFTVDTHTPQEIGHKALARSLSDLAAMGAEPVFCLVSLGMPPDKASAFLPKFYRGFLSLAKQFQISLAGGDLASFPHIVADVMCCGSVPKHKAFLRSAAKPGDAIYVTGTLGESALGLRTRKGIAWKTHRRPRPQLAIALQLRQFGVRCAMDLSDGLSLDLLRLCRESRVAAELSGSLPVARGASLEDALHGGEDYQLLFTARRRLPPELGGISVTRIGHIRESNRPQIFWAGKPLSSRGFDHFR